MEKLQNGVDSLIAYYFKITHYSFLDEYDLKFLIDLANRSGIFVESPNEEKSELFKHFLAKLEQTKSFKWGRYIKVGSSCLKSKAWDNIKQKFELLSRLTISESFIYRNRANALTFELDRDLETCFDELMGQDLEILKTHMPDNDTTKKYLTFKKVIQCKTPENNYLFHNIAAPALSVYPETNDLLKSGELKPDVYNFVNALEELLKVKNGLPPDEKIDKVNHEIKDLVASGITVNDISDTQHTFAFYKCQRMLSIAWGCNARPDICFKSKKNIDPMFDGEFIVGINTPNGVITYHFKLEYWDLFQIPELDIVPYFYGYTDDDINSRLKSLVKETGEMRRRKRGIKRKKDDN